jgi:lysyl-tRNA synthetase class 2
VPLLATASLVLCGLTVWIAAPESAGFGAILRATGDALLWQAGPFDFQDELGHLDEAIGVAGILTLAWCAYLLFRPLAVPRVFPGAEVRTAARELVRRHGADTLAYFKLRHDQHYLFGPDGSAFLGYRVEAGVLLVSGDPVGPDDAIPGLLRELSRFAESRGLRIAALGAGERLRPLWEQLGLRALYLGDEAVVETRAFSLAGRPIRKVRQSVNRLAAAGYTAEALHPREIGPELRGRLESIAREWRGSAPSRGFAMALDALFRLEDEDALFVIGRGPDREPEGFLHFALSPAGSALSLSSMPRLRTTPNGFNEWLVVETVDWARAHGYQRVSLNFAPFAALLTPQAELSRLQRVERRALLALKGRFQLDNLLVFNRKFFPSWERRFLVYERRRDLPRVGLAALAAEAYLPFSGRDRR